MEKSPSLTSTIVSIGIALSIGFYSIAFAGESQEEPEGQQFLFMNEDAYTQEKGQWQLSFTSQYQDRKKIKDGDEVKIKDQWQWVMESEYGLSEWLQINLEVPFLSVHKVTIEDGEATHLDKAGIGDVETGIRVRLIEEDDQWWQSTVSVGFGLSWPTGQWGRDLGTDGYGWEVDLLFSKTTDKWAYHLSGGFGMTDDAREQGESEKSDIEEFGVGGALVYGATDSLDIICELFSEFEREKSGTSVSHETVLYVVPGVGYKLFKDFEMGLGVPIGLTNESHDWGIIANIQYEW
jgi:hypothetical protein